MRFIHTSWDSVAGVSTVDVEEDSWVRVGVNTWNGNTGGQGLVFFLASSHQENEL